MALTPTDFSPDRAARGDRGEETPRNRTGTVRYSPVMANVSITGASKGIGLATALPR